MKQILRSIRLNTKGFLFFTKKYFFKTSHYGSKENYIAVGADPEWWEKHLNFTQLSQYKDKLTGHVADFGCNHGATTVLAARFPGVKKITGFDINPEAIKVAKTLALKEKTSAEKADFIASSFLNLKAESETFDSAYSIHTVEHIHRSEQKQCLSEIHRVLKKGAHFLVVVPHMYAYFDPTHEVAFSISSIQKLFQENGFHVLECYRDRRTDAYTTDGHDCIVLLLQKK